MTVGKACAQVAHAASQCARDIGHMDYYQKWERESYEDDQIFDDSMTGFGTTIVLDGGSFKDDGTDGPPEYIKSALNNDEGSYGTVLDVTYPIRDRKKTHLIPLVTCYWIFVDPEQNEAVDTWRKQFKLYEGNHD